MAVLAATGALACWLVGPGRVATAVRHGAGWLLDRAAALIAGARMPLGGVPATVASHRRGIEVALVVAALAGLVIWRHPGISGTLWLAAGLLLAVGLVELVSRLPEAVLAK